MSYASRKGYDGEVEMASYLNQVFSPFKFRFVRIGGIERNKKMLVGDVVLDHRTDPKELCFLRQYFLEAKKRSTIDLWRVIEETEKKAKLLNKWGTIVYATKQGRGSKREGTIIAMTKETFARIAKELQSYRTEDGTH